MTASGASAGPKTSILSERGARWAMSRATSCAVSLSRAATTSANQSFLGMALFLPHEAAISWAGFWYNQAFVVLGNVVGGGLFVGGLYWMVSPYRVPDKQLAAAPQPVSSAVVGS